MSEAVGELLIIGVVIGVAVLLHALWQRRFSSESLRKHNDVAGFLFSAVGVIYAVVLGFVVVVVWEKYDSTVANVETEIAAVSDLYRTVSGLSGPTRVEVRKELSEYTNQMIHGRMAADGDNGRQRFKGSSVDRNAGTSDRYVRSQNQGESNAQQEAMTQLNRLFDARRLRLIQSAPSVPLVLWFALVAGALAMLSFAFLFGVENRRAQLVMTAILAGLIAVLFIVISEFDEPFDGSVSISDRRLDGAAAAPRGNSVNAPARACASANAGTRSSCSVRPCLVASVAGTLRYATRSGALARIDGQVAGAFDREHRGTRRRLVAEPARADARGRAPVVADQRPAARTGRAMVAHESSCLTRRRFSTRVGRLAEPVHPPQPGAPADPVALWGHSHLDVAWLWSYSATRRKAMRTFANAANLLEARRSFVFTQSQPQLYEFVREARRSSFSRGSDGACAKAGSTRAWRRCGSSPTATFPSGESLLRQVLAAHRFCTRGVRRRARRSRGCPIRSGFARTLPSLLAHAGIEYFATTKLQWNDTSRFPYPQFRWRGPDGAEVVAAALHSTRRRMRSRRAWPTARARREPLVVGLR